PLSIVDTPAILSRLSPKDVLPPVNLVMPDILLISAGDLNELAATAVPVTTSSDRLISDFLSTTFNVRFCPALILIFFFTVAKPIKEKVTMYVPLESWVILYRPLLLLIAPLCN